MEKRIPYMAEVKSADYTPWKFTKLNSDGTVDWEIEPDEKGRGIPKRVPGDTIRLLREAITSIPRSIQAPDDPEWAWRALYHVHRNEDAMDALSTKDQKDGEGQKDEKPGELTHVALSPRVYKWLHELLNRKLPLSKDEREDQKYDSEKGEKDGEDKPKKLERQTYAQYLWNLSAYCLKCSLLDEEEQKKINLDEDP